VSDKANASRAAIGIAALFGALSVPALGQDMSSPDVPSRAERFYQERFCAGMDLEVRLGQQRRADCLDDTHAIEVDFHDKWKEAIGQSLAYSAGAAYYRGSFSFVAVTKPTA
jgi:hypothetical protein